MAKKLAFEKRRDFQLWRARDLDLVLGSGHTAYCRASLIDLYLHAKFHWNRRNLVDGRRKKSADVPSTAGNDVNSRVWSGDVTINDSSWRRICNRRISIHQKEAWSDPLLHDNIHQLASEYNTTHWSNADPGVQAVSPQVTISYPPGGRLPLLSARPAVTFPAAQHHRPLTGTKLYCLMKEAHRCEQLAQGCYAVFARSRIWTHDLLIASPTLYPLRHLSVYSN